MHYTKRVNTFFLTTDLWYTNLVFWFADYWPIANRFRLICAGWHAYYPLPKQALVFMCLQYKFLENTVGKGEIALNEQFLLFPVSSTLLDNSINQIWNCCLQPLSFWKNLKFFIWEGVNRAWSISFGSSFCQVARFIYVTNIWFLYIR